MNTLYKILRSEITPLIAPAFMACFSIWFTLILFLESFGADTPTNAIQAIGSLFSAIAVVVALFALSRQQENFRTQISELRVDGFNNTFVFLIKLHESIAAQIEYEGKKGKDAIQQLLAQYNQSEFLALLLDPSVSFGDLKIEYQEKVIPSYKALFSYLNTTSLILHFVDESFSLDDTRKMIYIDMFKAKATQHELSLLLYHTMFSNIDNNLLEISNKYSLFETIIHRSVSPAVREYYLPSAFGLKSWTDYLDRKS